MTTPNPQTIEQTPPPQNPALLENQQSEEDHQQQQTPHSNLQSSKTLISDHQDPQNLTPQNTNNPQETPQEIENPRDFIVELHTDAQNVDDVDASSAISPRTASYDTYSRRGSKRKRMHNHKRTAQEKKSREKFQVLVETLKPVPFVPAKNLDFMSHETLLRRLGLWDFVHVEFDRNIRSDLVAQLIAGYTPSLRSSYVNGMRIMVNRADLGRALKLPVKKTVVVDDDDLETLNSAESVCFVEEVVSNWMLLHEDTFIMPSEVLSFIKMIKEGHLEKVDWAGLIWQMVEKELKTPQLVNCYYASHLQQLIKVQREGFLREEPKVEMEVKEEEEEEEDDDYGGGDLKMSGAEDGNGGLKLGGVEARSSDPKSARVDSGGSDPKSALVQDGAADPKSAGVEDGGSDPKLDRVEDGGVDAELGRVEDCGGAEKLARVEDVSGESKLGVVEGVCGDPKLVGVADGNGDLKMDVVEDGSGDMKTDGVDDGSGDTKTDGVDTKTDGVDDGSGDTKTDGVGDGSGDTKTNGVGDGSGDTKTDGVGDGSGDTKTDGVGDGSGETKTDGVGDGSGDTKTDGVGDGSGDTKMDGVDVGSGDTKIDRTEDESGDVKMGGHEDGSSDLKTGELEGEGDDSKIGGADDRSGDLKMGEVDDGSVDLKMVEVDDCALRMGGVHDGNLRMGAVDSERGQELEEHNIELSLGQDNAEKVEVEKVPDVGEHIMNMEEFKEKEPKQWLLDRKNSSVMDIEELKEEEPEQWLLDRKNNGGEPFLRQCNFSDVNGLDGESKKEEGEGQEGGEDEGEEEEEDEEEAEEDDHEGGFHLTSKCMPLEGMSSGGLMQAMETGQMTFNSGIELRDNSIGDFLSSREDAHMISGPSLFNNGHKRDIGQDNNDSHHSLNGSSKRLRSDSPWNAKPADFEMCMEQIEHWIGKARMMHAAKEQSCEDLNMNQQVLLNELQKRNSIIDNLHKANMEESQKRQMEVYRLEKELYMMSNLLDGYRKALKETQKAFSEYRSKCPQADEPLYKDVPGSGGLVLSVMELEKERLKQEEEQRMKRLMIEKKLRDFEGGWNTKFEDHLSGIQLLGDRLLAVEAEVKNLNELNAKRKVSDPPECPPSEEQA